MGSERPTGFLAQDKQNIKHNSKTEPWWHSFVLAHLSGVMRSPFSSFDLIEHYKRKRGWTEERTRMGAREEFGGSRARGHSEIGNVERTDGRTRRKAREVDGDRARSLARTPLHSPVHPTACMQIETGGSLARSSVETGGGRKVLKQGKECPRQWRGRPRPPTAAGQRRIYLGAATAFAASAASSFFSFLGREMAAPKDHL